MCSSSDFCQKFHYLEKVEVTSQGIFQRLLISCAAAIFEAKLSP